MIKEDNYWYDSYTCRIDINMIIKIADFGLSVNIGAKEYYRLTKHMDVKLPVKWMAPESLADYVFSEMSDVVSDSIKGFSYYCNIESERSRPILIELLAQVRESKVIHSSMMYSQLP